MSQAHLKTTKASFADTAGRHLLADDQQSTVQVPSRQEGRV